MAAGGEGQGDGGVGGAAGGDGGVPGGGRVGGAGGQKGQLTHDMKAHVHARVLSRMIRGASRGENSDDLTSDPGDIDGGREVQWMKRDKALYAQHDAGAKDLSRYLLTETRQLTHIMTSQRIGGCSRQQETILPTHSMAGGGRGRRECRYLASPSVACLIFHKCSVDALLPGCDTLCLVRGKSPAP